FVAFAAPPTDDDWIEMAQLLEADREVAFTPDAMELPDNWVLEEEGRGYQMIADHLMPASKAASIETVHDLGAADVDDIFALFEAARPGPFERRTIAFGDYRGIRNNGAL